MIVTYNPNRKIVRMVKEKIADNGGYCPCRRGHSEDNRCMCREFREQIADPDFTGYCLCRLYYKSY